MSRPRQQKIIKDIGGPAVHLALHSQERRAFLQKPLLETPFSWFLICSILAASSCSVRGSTSAHRKRGQRRGAMPKKVKHREKVSKIFRVARRSAERILARKIFLGLRIFSRKMLRNFPRNVWAFILWVWKNPVKFLPNFPRNFPPKNFLKIADELLQGRRVKKYFRHFSTFFAQGKKRQKSSKSVKTIFGTFRQFSRGTTYQGRKRNPNPNFLVRVFSGGVGVFHVKGWGPKSSVCPSKVFWRDIPGFCRDIPEVPEKFERKKFVFNFRSLTCPAPTFGGLWQQREHPFCAIRWRSPGRWLRNDSKLTLSQRRSAFAKRGAYKSQKNPRAHKNKIGTSPPPPKRGILWTLFFLQSGRIFPGVHKIGAAISGPRIADKNFTDTRIFLKKGFEETWHKTSPSSFQLRTRYMSNHDCHWHNAYSATIDRGTRTHDLSLHHAWTTWATAFLCEQGKNRDAPLLSETLQKEIHACKTR